MFGRLEGQTAIVTGASRGIGKGIARVLASSGANVLVMGRDEGACAATAREITEKGGSASLFVGDVASLDSMNAMAKAAVERYGRIDILCANAGIFPQVSIEKMTSEQWDEVQAVNLRGMFHSVKACLPAMKSQKYGRVVLTSSITGPNTGYPGWSHYGCSKAGMLGFMRTAALELAPHGITVNAVLPGNIRTETLETLGEEYVRGMAAVIPQKKLGEVEDIGYAALFFATREAKFVTGQSLIIDGGQVLPESPQAILELSV